MFKEHSTNYSPILQMFYTTSPLYVYAKSVTFLENKHQKKALIHCMFSNIILHDPFMEVSCKIEWFYLTREMGSIILRVFMH